MRVVSYSPSDGIGGADRVAMAVHAGALRRGLDAEHVVEARLVDDRLIPTRSLVPSLRTRAGRVVAAQLRDAGHLRLARVVRGAAEPRAALARLRGHQDGSLQATWRLADDLGRGDVLHIHNVHSSEFAIDALPRLAARAAVVMTLHDMWWLTGHCAHSFACERWQRGCGDCPDLTITPAVRRDATARNWRKKRALVLATPMTVVTPSQWLQQRARSEQSLLHTPSTRFELIPNGVDLDTFHPRRREAARAKLGVAGNEVVLAFVGASATTNVFKDAATLLRALALLRSGPAGVTAFVVGDEGPDRPGSAAVTPRYLGRLGTHDVADVLAAADLYVHPARAENHPLAVLEALASGTAVVGSDVGGIPEQIDRGVTGALVPVGDAEALARVLNDLVANPLRLREMGAAARADAERRFDVELMVDRYVALYRQLSALR